MSDIIEYMGIEIDREEAEDYGRRCIARARGLKREHRDTPNYTIDGATFGGAKVYGYVQRVDWLDEDGRVDVTDFVPSLRIVDGRPNFYLERFSMDLRAEKSMDEAMAAFKAWGKRHGGTRLIEQFE